jgi:hypothetical protein
MVRLTIVIVIWILPTILFSQNNVDKLNEPYYNISNYDTLKSFLIKKDPSFLYSLPLKNNNRSLGVKLLHGTTLSTAYNLTIGATLLVLPEHISMWDKSERFKWEAIKQQYKSSFTTPPVVDQDMWYINYVGHPYQGAYYYNNVRSQGATVLESSLFTTAQALLWEYVWEGGVEPPSIQDLIVTPIAGIILGELFHVATIKMGRNGFEWYEIAAVCILNPSYAINNGFKKRSKIPIEP